VVTLLTLGDMGAGEAPTPPNPLLEVANVMVHLYKDAFGRGPTRSRALFSGSDTLVVLLEDVKCSEVERIIGRPVVACLSGSDPAHDLATEVFVFEPRA
jgi:uncharacterized protein YbcI